MRHLFGHVFPVAVLAIVALGFAIPARAQACQCGSYNEIDHSEESDTLWCSVSQYSCSSDAFCAAQTVGAICVDGSCVRAGHERMTYMFGSTFCCEDGRKVYQYPISSTTSACGQGPIRMGEITSWSCSATCSTPDEEMCDGRDNDNDGAADEGCADGECSELDGDEHPVRFSSGRVEAQPVISFSVPAPSDMFFGVAVRWGSHLGRLPHPRLYSGQSATDFMGRGFLDVYGDRLHIADAIGSTIPATPARIEWQSFRAAHRFNLIGTTGTTANYQTSDGTHLLTATPSSMPTRYEITRRSDNRRFVFQPVDYQVPVTMLRGRIGVLTEIRAPAAAGAGYAITLDRDTDGRLLIARDSYGRSLAFRHELIGGVKRIADVSYSAPSTVPIVVTRFIYGNVDATRLVAIDRAGRGWTRMRYHESTGTTPCLDCTRLVDEVIVSQTRTALPPEQAPRQPGELVTEGHLWAFASNARPIARGSYGPARRWGYVFDDSAACSTTGICRTEQLDLQHGDGAVCDGDNPCPMGTGCWAQQQGDAGSCYPSTIIEYDRASRHVLGRRGHLREGEYEYGYDAQGRVRFVLGADGRYETTSYDNEGRVACRVTGDDDEEAGVPPLCDAPPPTAGEPPPSVVAHSYAASVETTTWPGQLPGVGLTTEELRDAAGAIVATIRSGNTRTIDGVVIRQSRTTHRQIDGLGRTFVEIGPDDDADTVDSITRTYHATGYGAGMVHTETRLSGDRSAPHMLLTRYEDYDAWAVPRRVIDPQGRVTTLTISTDGRVTQATTCAGAPALCFVATTATGDDGSPHYVIDPDGVCTTFESRADALVKKRSHPSDPGCGVLPIDDSSGEVEIRRRDAARPTEIRRTQHLLDGVVFYDEEAEFDDLGRNVQTSFGGVVRSGVHYDGDSIGRRQAGDCPGPSCIEESKGFDALGRLRFLAHVPANGGPPMTADFDYAGHAILPTTLTRGADHAPILTSEFAYDDFGRVIEATSPDGALVRTAYDAGGRVTAVRTAPGTNAQRTDVNTYDDLGRVVFVDYDVEHPVDCSVAPTGTPIADVERAYDRCLKAPPGFACENASGRVTIERTLLGCVSGTTWSRAEYTTYDAHGRITRTAIAFAHDGVIDAGATYVAAHAFTAAGRELLAGNPLSPAFSTLSIERPDGAGVNVWAHDAPSAPTFTQPVATSFERAPFGHARQSLLGTRLKMSASFDASGSPRTWRAWNASSGVAYVDATMRYDSAGRLVERDDRAALGEDGASLFVGRDPLGRIQCESSAVADLDCAHGTFAAAYTDGASSAAPPDQREQAIVSSIVEGGALERSVYVPGTTRLEQLRRGTVGVTSYEYDLLGRVVDETDSADPVLSRHFTYLPSGRLGRIEGTSATGAPYALSLLHDAAGRVVLVSDGLSGQVEEYFYGAKGTSLEHEIVAASRSGATESTAVFGECPCGIVDAGKVSSSADGRCVVSLWSDGTYAVGTVDDLDAVTMRHPFSLPKGRRTADILAVTSGDGGGLLAYLRDGSLLAGDDPTSLKEAGNYEVAKGLTPRDIVAVAHAPAAGGFVAWYTDTTFSIGSETSLGAESDGTRYKIGGHDPTTIDGVVLRARGDDVEAHAFTSAGDHFVGTIDVLDNYGVGTIGLAPGPGSQQRWSFHRAEGRLVAATRELLSGTGSTAERFLFVTDERGAVLQAVDESGALHFSARQGLFGDRTVRLQQPMMWVPFALPGQIVLERTLAANGAERRPPLALNGAREYDPRTARFLQPDPVDWLPREDPEGYVLARSDPMRWADPSGTLSIHWSCPTADRVNIGVEVAWAMAQVSSEKCQGHKKCGPDYARRVLERLMDLEIRCHSRVIQGTVAPCGSAPSFPLRSISIREDITQYGEIPAGTCPSKSQSGCLAQVILHEALHTLEEDLGLQTHDEIFELAACVDCR